MFKNKKVFIILCFLCTSCSVLHKLKQFVGLNKTLIESNFKSQEIKAIIKQGYKFKGVPYRTGGMDETGMDCSGLLFKIYQLEGFEIPRLVKDQSNFGLPVSLSEIKAGDWIFFRTNNSLVVNHSGIVTTSNGGFNVVFLHASTSKGVREDNLNSNYWSKALYKVIRPFKN
jgi:cell wall-associated NlpC family hydrolase